MTAALDLDPVSGPGIDDGLDFGLSDTDFGAGIVTLVAALSQDTPVLAESAKVENLALLVACSRWLDAEVGARVADLAASRGGPTDEGSAVDAAVGSVGAVRPGREPRPRFWEQAVLGARLRLSEFEARQLVSTSIALYGDRTGPGAGAGAGAWGRLANTAAALEAGEISWQHAEALAVQTADLSVADAAEVEVTVLSDRRAVTAGQFRHRAKAKAEQLKPTAEPAPRAGSASMWEQIDGTIRLDATLDADGGRILARAVDAYATVTGPDDQRPLGQRQVDALVEIGQVALDHLDPTRAAAIRRTGRHPHLTLITDTRTHAADSRGRAPAEGPAPAGTPVGQAADTSAGMTAGRSAGTTVLDGSGYLRPTTLDPWTAGWLTCCADQQTARVDNEGRIVGLGDILRRMPGVKLRREIALRDQGCRGPGCTRPIQRCRPHHVRFHAHGGPTTADNLLSLCEVHHQAIHRDGWHLHFDGTTATFTDPHGRTYQSPPPLAAPPPPPTNDEPFLQPSWTRPPKPAVPQGFSPFPFADDPPF